MSYVIVIVKRCPGKAYGQSGDKLLRLGLGFNQSHVIFASNFNPLVNAHILANTFWRDNEGAR